MLDQVKGVIAERYGVDVASYVGAHLLDIRFFTFVLYGRDETAVMHNGFIVTSLSERLRWVWLKATADGDVEIRFRCGTVRVLHPSPPFALGIRFEDLLKWVDMYWKSVFTARNNLKKVGGGDGGIRTCGPPE